MSVATFIPKLWSARLIDNLNANRVGGAFVNRDYEGDIRHGGDTVHINNVGTISVSDYKRGTPITIEDLTTEDRTLTVDQDKYFAFSVEDVDKAQAAGDVMDAAMYQASLNLLNAEDKYTFATLAKEGTKATLGELNADGAYGAIVALGIALDKTNAPATGRVVCVNPDFYGWLLQDDRFVKAGTDAGEQRLATGYIGQAAGFTVYKSNNLPEHTIIADVPSAATFAEQVLNVEAIRSQNAFGDIVRGQAVYGAKVTQAKAVAVGTYTLKA